MQPIVVVPENLFFFYLNLNTASNMLIKLGAVRLSVGQLVAHGVKGRRRG